MSSLFELLQGIYQSPSIKQAVHIQQSCIPPQILKDLASIHQQFLKFQIIHNDTLIFSKLSDYGWILPNQITHEFYNELINTLNSPDVDSTKIETVFIDYYQKDSFQELKKIVKNWGSNPHFCKRMPIFQDNLNFLEKEIIGNNVHNLIIPSLLCQVDGILKDFMELDFTRKEKERKDYIRNNFNVNSVSDFLVMGLFDSHLYCENKFNNNAIINRNAIMHGEDLKYGTIQNTLRLFLFIDYFYGELK